MYTDKELLHALGIGFILGVITTILAGYGLYELGIYLDY